MVIEKKIIKIKESLDQTIDEQKRVLRMIDLFIQTLFLVFVMFMVS